MAHDIYMVVQPGKYFSAKIVRFTRKNPVLLPGQLAFKLVIDIPNKIFRPPELEVKLGEENVIRPKPTIRS